MRKKYIFGKKLYISVLTSILVLLTTVATTFAWVGVFANSTFESFDVTIKSSSLEEFGVVISATGEEGTFSDTIDAIDIKRQILRNWGYHEDYLVDEDDVNRLFSMLSMDQVTTLPTVSGNKLKKLGTFKSIEGFNTKHYFKFDIYVSAVSFYNTGSDNSSFLMDAFIGAGLLTGTEKSFTLGSSFTFPSTFSNPLSSLPAGIRAITGGEEIHTVTVNSASAARVAFEKYPAVDLGHPEQYSSSVEPYSAVIYSGDSYDYPTHNEITNVSEFGGILPDSCNLAINYYNGYDAQYTRNGIHSVSLPAEMYNVRGVESSTKDLILSSSNNHIINSSNVNERISLNKMMKMTVYMWFEGWDADCFNVINNSPVKLSISLSMSNEEIF